MGISQRRLFVLCGIVAICACGCRSPEKRFKQTGAQIYREGDAPAGVAFSAVVDTRWLRGQQFMYKVRLMDERARSIKSNDRAYEDSSGNVAAQKTLMVFGSRRGPEHTEVRIPMYELGLRSGDFPVWISYGLYKPDGTTFAVVYRPMPRNTQSIVRRFVDSTYGHESSAIAPSRESPRRRVRRTTGARSQRWRPKPRSKGLGFCPRHGVACECPLRQDVPSEYAGSRDRNGFRSERGRSPIGSTRPRRGRPPSRLR